MCDKTCLVAAALWFNISACEDNGQQIVNGMSVYKDQKVCWGDGRGVGFGNNFFTQTTLDVRYVR